MTTRLKFLYVCERTFAGLPGEDAQRRRCDQCATIVHNLDAMAPTEQAQVLLRAMAEETTVCVSLAVPGAEAQACRAGRPIEVGPSPFPPPGDGPVLAGVVAVDTSRRWEPARPQRGDGVSEFRGFGQELPAVTGALREVAGAFGLAEETWSREPRWSGRSDDPPAVVEVLVTTEAGRTTVAVKVEPLPALVDRAPGPVGRILLGLPLVWIGCGIAALAGAGLVAGWIALGLTGALVLAALGVRAVEAWRGSARAWGRTWRRRFWAALEERLARRQPYRSAG